jgi:hypothetical protein
MLGEHRCGIENPYQSDMRVAWPILHSCRIADHPLAVCYATNGRSNSTVGDKGSPILSSSDSPQLRRPDGPDSSRRR